LFLRESILTGWTVECQLNICRFTPVAWDYVGLHYGMMDNLSVGFLISFLLISFVFPLVMYFSSVWLICVTVVWFYFGGVIKMTSLYNSLCYLAARINIVHGVMLSVKHNRPLIIHVLWPVHAYTLSCQWNLLLCIYQCDVSGFWPCCINFWLKMMCVTFERLRILTIVNLLCL